MRIPGKYQTLMASFLALGLLLGLSARAATQETALGDWHGTLTTPGGDLTLLVILGIGEDGRLTGNMESPDQAPGQLIPLNDVTVAGDRLSFAVRAIAANYSGQWVEAEGHWSGQWQQGISLPLILEPGPPPDKTVVSGLDGAWKATLERNDARIRLVFRVQTGDRGTTMTLDSPDFGAFDLPVTDFERQDATIRFAVPAAAVEFSGQLNVDAGTLEGTWHRRGQNEVRVRFQRGDDPAARSRPDRPQEPDAESTPYGSELVTIPNPAADEVILAGTLTLPQGGGPFPAAVLISGSGPQDRDESIFGHRPFAVLADHLTRRGIAVLRYDDRGAGESTGNFSLATSEDFASDANAAANWLRERPEVDPDAIGFIGHSEGGVVGPLAATANPEIDYLVLLAAPGTDMTRLLLSQRRLVAATQGLSEDFLDRSEPLVRQLFQAAARAGDSAAVESRVREILTPNALAALGMTAEQKPLAIKQFSRDWLRYLLRYDPATTLKALMMPVLALNGSLDTQVPADENLAAIRTVLSDHPDATIRRLDGLNHMFQSAQTGAIGEYRDIEETFAPVALESISEWILELRSGARTTRVGGH